MHLVVRKKEWLLFIITFNLIWIISNVAFCKGTPDTSKYGVDGAPLHDPCTVAFLLKPELFEGKKCNIAIEIHSELTMGNTAVDFWGVSGRDKNAVWIHSVDADGFYELLTDRLTRYGGS